MGWLLMMVACFWGSRSFLFWAFVYAKIGVGVSVSEASGMWFCGKGVFGGWHVVYGAHGWTIVLHNFSCLTDTCKSRAGGRTCCTREIT